VALGTREPGTEEVPYQFDGELGTDHARAERDDVHVVVLDPLMSGEGIVTERTTNAGELARGDARPDAAPAHEDAALGLAFHDSAANGCRHIGIVITEDWLLDPQVAVFNSLRRRSGRVGGGRGQSGWLEEKAGSI